MWIQIIDELHLHHVANTFDLLRDIFGRNSNASTQNMWLMHRFWSNLILLGWLGQDCCTFTWRAILTMIKYRSIATSEQFRRLWDIPSVWVQHIHLKHNLILLSDCPALPCKVIKQTTTTANGGFYLPLFFSFRRVRTPWLLAGLQIPQATYSESPGRFPQEVVC